MAPSAGTSNTADSDDAIIVQDAAVADPALKSASTPSPTSLLIMLIGALGFVALLISSHYVPTLANPLRVAALVWFFVFGAAHVSLASRR